MDFARYSAVILIVTLVIVSSLVVYVTYRNTYYSENICGVSSSVVINSISSIEDYISYELLRGDRSIFRNLSLWAYNDSTIILMNASRIIDNKSLKSNVSLKVYVEKLNNVLEYIDYLVSHNYTGYVLFRELVFLYKYYYRIYFQARGLYYDQSSRKALVWGLTNRSKVLRSILLKTYNSSCTVSPRTYILGYIVEEALNKTEYFINMLENGRGSFPVSRLGELYGVVYFYDYILANYLEHLTRNVFAGGSCRDYLEGLTRDLSSRISQLVVLNNKSMDLVLKNEGYRVVINYLRPLYEKLTANHGEYKYPFHRMYKLVRVYVIMLSFHDLFTYLLLGNTSSYSLYTGLVVNKPMINLILERYDSDALMLYSLFVQKGSLINELKMYLNNTRSLFDLLNCRDKLLITSNLNILLRDYLLEIDYVLGRIY